MAIKRRRTALKRILYQLRYRFGEYAARGFMRCLPYLPVHAVSFFASCMSRLAFVLLWRYRNRMAENIALTLGQEISDPAARQALVWQAWHNFARSVMDTTQAMFLSKDRIIESVTLVGEEHLQAALARGKGVVALSAHLGAFTLIGPRLAAAGYPFSVVVKHPTDKRFAQLTDDYRARVGIHTIAAKPRRNAVRGILTALRENRIVLVIADEFKSGEVLVDFFGAKVPAPRGPATLALRAGAVTLPMFAIRQPDHSLLLSIGAPIEPVLGEDLESSILATTALYTSYLEQAIRRYPAQWNWLGLPRNGKKIASAKIVREAQTAPGASSADDDAEIGNTATLP